MHKRFYPFLISTFLVLFLAGGIISCNREKSPDPIADFGRVTIFDDTTASGENASIRITSGQSRLYMTYGKGSTYYSFFNGLVFESAIPLACKVMATDLAGNLLWRYSFPERLAITSAVELNDGSCFVAGANLWGYSMSLSAKDIFLFHLSADGKLISRDSIQLPADFGTEYFMYMDILKKPDGNVMIYGTTNNFANSDGFIIHYNATTGSAQFKPLVYRKQIPASGTVINNAISTKDGGYLFLGLYPGDSSTGNPQFAKTVLIKTNANGDTTWTKRYDYFSIWTYMNIPFACNVIEMPNGHFRFAVNENTNYDYRKFRAFIYEVNERGDSLKAITIQKTQNTYCPLLINNRNGQTLALINEYPVSLLPSFSGVFTWINTEGYWLDDKMNVIRSGRLQGGRSDFITAACNIPDGRIALYGMLTTRQYTSYVPFLTLLN